jgi:hypothetical protein
VILRDLNHVDFESTRKQELACVKLFGDNSVENDLVSIHSKLTITAADIIVLVQISRSSTTLMLHKRMKVE